MNLKFSMAINGLCSLVEASQLEYHKAIAYRDMYIDRQQKANESYE